MRTSLLVVLLLVLCAPLRAQTPQDGFDMFQAPLQEVPVRLLDVERVQLFARVDSVHRLMSVELRASVRALRSQVVQFTWPTHGLTIDSVRARIPGADTTLAVVHADSLVFTVAGVIPASEASLVSIWYRVPFGRGLETSSDPKRARSCCVWTTARWIPLPDDPGDRFRSELQVMVPASWSVVSGGRQTRSGQTFGFELPRPARVQDLGFAAGVFRVTVRDRRAYFVPEGTSGSLSALDAELRPIQSYLERTTGFRLPWDTTRVAFLPLPVLDAHRSGQLERSLPGFLGLDQRRLRTPRTIAPGATEELAELLARQWSHGVLGPDWWSEAWVNEALAGVLALSYLEDQMGDAAAAPARLSRLDRYLAEAERYRRPLVWDRFRTPEDLLDQHALAKGPLVLFDIRARMGVDAFEAALRRFIARNAFGSVDSDVLLEALRTAGSEWLTGVFESWIWGAGHPEITVQTDFDAAAETIFLTATQTQEGPLVPAAFPLDTRVDWLLLAGVETAPLSSRERETSWTGSASIAPRFVSLDPDGLLTARIRAHRDLSSLGAVLRYGAVFDKLRAARELPDHRNEPAAALSLRLAYYSTEVAAVRSELLGAAGRFPAGNSTTEILTAGLADPDPRVRISAIAALASQFAAGDMDARFENVAQTDTLYAVQAAAVRAMSGNGARALALAAMITPSEDDVLLDAGVDVLVRLGQPTRDQFLTHTDTDQAAGHIRLALKLAPVVASDRQTRLRVLALLAHPDVSVRMAAARAGRSLLRRGNAPAVRERIDSEWHAGVAYALARLADHLDTSPW